MSEFGIPEKGLTGSLLISHPSLRDPNFLKTVLFISAHDGEEGCFGLILNRPAGRTVGDLLPGQALGPLQRLPVFLGGPVGVDQLAFAAFTWHPETEHMECHHHLNMEQAEEYLHDEHSVVRAYIGYSGWSKGQLEGELEQKAWVVAQPSSDVLEAAQGTALWKETLSRFGPWYRLVAEAPDDLSAS